MSALTKKHPIEFVRVEIEGKKRKRLFNVPKEKADGLLKLISEFEEDSIPWREAFSDLIAETSEIATILRGARHKAEMNQSQVAEALGVSQSYIAQLETGKKTISKGLAIKFGKLFDVDYKVFL